MSSEQATLDLIEKYSRLVYPDKEDTVFRLAFEVGMLRGMIADLVVSGSYANTHRYYTAKISELENK